jgi:uncharacterized phage protein (TIGR02218 family)
MRAASGSLITLLNTTTEFRVADLLTIVQADGTTTRWTSADADITAVSRVDNASHTFSSTGPRFTRGATKLAVGLEVDTLALKIFPNKVTDTLGGVPWPQAIRQGSLDEARITLERAFMPTFGDTSAGTVILFSGRVGQADSLRDEISIEVKSDLELLGLTLMPRNVYQPGCLHTLFDAGCGLVKATYAVSGTAAAASTAIAIQSTLGQATGYFDLGTIEFTSGLNAGITRGVRSWVTGSPGTIALMRPFPYAPANGDAYTMTPGCDKAITPAIPLAHAGDVRYGTCQAKFSNVARARAFPFVPTPETAI